ncbi:hypothetical protein RRG08_027451 [Elysia crispata]|uniref:Uncharacterized protein n=1 Tax=Elysia crispata TaxID=231223 RepID=A0AAE1D361_9GAST|nr:hypothetical protein RRG08_027451 [Elysia crispata]
MRGLAATCSSSTQTTLGRSGAGLALCLHLPPGDIIGRPGIKFSGDEEFRTASDDKWRHDMAASEIRSKNCGKVLRNNCVLQM